MEIIIYVGMDVHKDSYSLCCYDPRSDRYLYEHKLKSTTANVIKYLENVKKQPSITVLYNIAESALIYKCDK